MSVYIKFNFPNSSTEALDRVVEAYGFSMKVQLSEHLGIAASSLSARYKRDVFPSDIVLQCAMETGANLEWLVTGKGPKLENSKSDTLTLSRKKLVNGKIESIGYVMLDKTMILPPKPELKNPICLVDEGTQYIIEHEFSEVFDGDWLVEIEGKTSIRRLTRIPVKRIKVHGDGTTFDCNITDITIIGHVALKVE